MNIKMIAAVVGIASFLLWSQEAHAESRIKTVTDDYEAYRSARRYASYEQQEEDTDEQPVQDPNRIRFEVGAGLLGMSTFSGLGDPADLLRPLFYLRFRVHKRVALVLEPAFIGADFDKVSFSMVGVRPAAHWTMVEGKGKWRGSVIYGITGLDFLFPTSLPKATPTMFFGGDLGLGVLLATTPVTVGFGAEIRAVVRGGVGNQVNSTVQNMSDLRFGIEVRPLLVHLCF
jgi:hypothetical protein